MIFMKEIIINDNNLIDNDIERVVVRVKGLIINSRGQILLAHNNNTYQFPGGHMEDDETMDECIIREIKDETGIKLEVTEKPFLCITTYDSNYFNTGRKVKNSIYYYRFFSDDVPNYEETHYDELELKSDFNLFYVNFSNLDLFLKKCINDGSIDRNIGREMLHVFEIYNEVFNGEK